MLAADAKDKFRTDKRQLVVGVVNHVVADGYAKVDGAGVHKFAHLQRACFQHFQLHLGVCLAVRIENLRKQKCTDHCGNGNLDVIAVVAHVFHLHGKGVHRLQNIVDLVQKVGAFHRQLQPIVSAMEQSHAKLAFQFLYAKGNRRLTDKQFLRRLCNTAVAAHRLKILHLQQLHCLLPRVIAHLRLAIKINEIQSFINFIYVRLYQIFC